MSVEESQAQETPIFYERPQQNLPSIRPQGDIILARVHIDTHALCLGKRHTTFVFQGCSWYSIDWKSPRQKVVIAVLIETAETRQASRE